jgi:hypothetical protein
MNLKRGDVVNARFPHASGGRGKKRPVVVVQAEWQQTLQVRQLAYLERGMQDRITAPATEWRGYFSPSSIPAYE